jgi:hypothetical protein
MTTPRKDPLEGPIIAPQPTEERPLRVLIVAGSQRRHNSCPGLDSKARALMLRMAARMPPGWQVDTEDLGNQHGKPKIQACNACVSSSMALCVYPCNCYGPRSTTQPDLMWDLDLYGRLARADAWAFIGPTNWYGPSTNFKLMFDRLVCAAGRQSAPRPDRQEGHAEGPGPGALAGVAAADPEPPGGPHGGASSPIATAGPTRSARTAGPSWSSARTWFDPVEEPYQNERLAYQGLVWQCRYSGIEVPDACGWPACSARASPTPTTRSTT